MSLETRAKEAALRAKGEAMSVEVPESEDVVRERWARQRTRVGVVSTVVVLIVAVGVVALIASRHDDHSSLATSHPVPRARLEFREVQGELPYTSAQPSTSCENGLLVTPPALRTARADVNLPDRADKHGKHSVCYELGPVLLDGSGITSAQPFDDPSTGWVLNIHFGNDDFLMKVARPEVNKNVAIVVDDVVQSAPVINPGITGRDVTITGNFTEAEATQLAAELNGVQPSDIKVPPAATPTTQPLSPGLQLVGLPPRCDPTHLAGTMNCMPEVALSIDVAATSVRHDKDQGWVVDIKLKTEELARFGNDKPVEVQVDGVGASATRNGNVFTVIGPQAAFPAPMVGPWTQARAQSIAQHIKDGN
jgi:hypothetical protein